MFTLKLKFDKALDREHLKAGKLRRQSESLKRKIKREVRNAFDDLTAEARRQYLSTQKFELAKNALELAKIRYERGISDNLDILDAETAFSEAELDILRAKVTYNITAVRLAHALGILNLEWLRLSLKNIR